MLTGWRYNDTLALYRLKVVGKFEESGTTFYRTQYERLEWTSKKFRNSGKAREHAGFYQHGDTVHFERSVLLFNQRELADRLHALCQGRVANIAPDVNRMMCIIAELARDLQFIRHRIEESTSEIIPASVKERLPR